MKELDWDYLFDILDYNTVTGIFTNKITRSSNAIKGDIAGCIKDDGYVVIHIQGTLYYAHRLAGFYEYGKWPIDFLINYYQLYLKCGLTKML